MTRAEEFEQLRPLLFAIAYRIYQPYIGAGAYTEIGILVRQESG